MNQQNLLDPAIVKDIADMIAYQEGAVVSRQIIKSASGSLTLFAFDKDQGLSEHTAPFDALVQLIDGSAEIVIDGKVHPIHQGQLILMPANIPHALRATERFKMLLTMSKT